MCVTERETGNIKIYSLGKKIYNILSFHYKKGVQGIVDIKFQYEVPLHDSSCKFTLFSLPVAQQPKSGLDSLVLKFQFHTQTHAVRLLSTSDRLLAETVTSTTRNKHKRRTYSPSGIRNRGPSNRQDADLRLRLRGHRDRQIYAYAVI
jgi:hypothetical protein